MTDDQFCSSGVYISCLRTIRLGDSLRVWVGVSSCVQHLLFSRDASSGDLGERERLDSLTALTCSSRRGRSLVAVVVQFTACGQIDIGCLNICLSLIPIMGRMAWSYFV